LRRWTPGRLKSLGHQLAVAGVAAALSRFALMREIGPHDEGLMLQAGSRMAAGQRPYRDFWANYPPGQPVVLAGIERLFGPSLRNWRILRVGLDTTTTVLAYRLTRRQAPERLALAASLATAGAMAFPQGPGPNSTAVALTFAALLNAPSHPRRAGALAGLATFFRLEIGAAAISGAALSVAPSQRAATCVTAASVAAVTLAPFAAAAPRAMLTDTIGFARIQHLQRLPLGLRYEGPRRPSKLIEFYMPAISLTALGLWAADAGTRVRDGRIRGGKDRRALPPAAGRGRTRSVIDGDIALAPLALVGAGYLLGRVDEFHLSPLTAVLGPMLGGAAAARPPSVSRWALLGALWLVIVHGLERLAGQALHPASRGLVPGMAGAGVETDLADSHALAQLLAAVSELTEEHEPIFVANPRHDVVRVGHPLLYTILGHPNPTRYDVMQPGLVTTSPVQEEIVQALERSRIRVVVRWSHPTASLREPGASRLDGADTLDEFLAAEFHEHARYGDYSLLVRRPSPQPPAEKGP
jgi:hypothetical protein